MGKVADGVKLGVGLWLFFKIILPLIVLAMVVVAVAIAYAFADFDLDSDGPSEPELVVKSASTVTYNATCNIRAAPRISARRIGRIRAGRAGTVLEQRGKWRKLRLGKLTGWAGCTDVRR